MPGALPTNLATDVAADIRAALDIFRRLRTHPDCPARHLPALDDAIAANERALAQLEATMPGDLIAPTG